MNTVETLLKATFLKTAEGERFINTLMNVGLLEQYDSRLFLSRFSRSYLSL